LGAFGNGDRASAAMSERKRKPMNWKTRAFSAALLMSAAMVAASGLISAPAGAAPAITLENRDKALADAVNGAQADAKAGRYADALAKAKTADALP